MWQLAHIIKGVHRARAGICRPIGVNRYDISTTMKVTQISDVIHLGTSRDCIPTRSARPPWATVRFCNGVGLAQLYDDILASRSSICEA